MQKGARTSCILLLVGCPAFIFVVHRYLPAELGDARIWFSVTAGTLLATGLSSLGLLLAGRVETSADLIERSQTAALVDGEMALVTGRLRASAPLLTAPISGTPCVAYFYRMYKVVRSATTDTSEEIPAYWGYASIPFVVEMSSRSMAVRGAPLFVVPRTLLRGDEAVASAREFIRTASATARNPRVVFAGDPVQQWMSGLSSSEDGSARHDWKSDQDDPSSLNLEESLLLPNGEVSVHGPWSARRNAIATDAGRGEVRVAPGRPSELGGLVPRSGTTYWVSTLVTLALGAAVIWFAVNVWPTLKFRAAVALD
jgi:hypothetical protein